MLYKSTCWEDIQRSIQECPLEPLTVEMAWNTLKTLPNSYQADPEFMGSMVEKTMEVTEGLTERGCASVWHAMAKMNVLDPGLMHKLTMRVMDHEIFLNRFHPRHLMNIFHSVAKLHRLARTRRMIGSTGEAFVMEKSFVKQLLQESARRLNEFNQQDLSSLASSLAILQVPSESRIYRQLSEEVEKEIHLTRFTHQDMLSVAFGLSCGGRLDLFSSCGKFTEELISARRVTGFNSRQLALLARCLCTTQAQQKKADLVKPIFTRLIHPEALPLLKSIEFRSAVVGLGFFRIQDPHLWRTLTQHLNESSFAGMSLFDLTSVLYAMGLVRFYHQELLDKISTALLEDVSALKRLSRLGLSNCFFGMAILNYRNPTLATALCDAVLQPEMLQALTPPQMANITFSLSQIGFRHDGVIKALVEQACHKLEAFPTHALLYFVFGLALDSYFAKPGKTVELFEEIFTMRRLQHYSNSEIGMAMCALGKLKPSIGHKWPTILQELQKPQRLTTYTLSDITRIVRAMRDLKMHVPILLKDKILSKLQEVKALPNRLLLDYLHCLEYLKAGEMIPDVHLWLEDAISVERLTQFQAEEIAECVVSVATLSSQLSASLGGLMERLLEKIIVHRSLENLTPTALYFALSVLGHSRCKHNSPLLYSLAMECSRAHRLEIYNEQLLSGIFYNLSILRALHRTAFDAFVEQMLLPKRLERYRQNHVVKLLRGLSIGRHKHGLIANSILNAFLTQDVELKPSSIAGMLHNLVLLDCWRRPYVDQLVQRIAGFSDLSSFSMWDLGVVIFALGRGQHNDNAVLSLIFQQLTKERLMDASNMDLRNFVYGLSQFQIEDESVVPLLLSEVLKQSRCVSYSDTQLVHLLQSLAEWQSVDACQLAGLTEMLRSPQRCAAMRSHHLLSILKSLSKLRLFGDDVVGRLLMELTGSEQRLKNLNAHELHDLRYLCSLARSSGASERIQCFLTAKSEPASI